MKGTRTHRSRTHRTHHQQHNNNSNSRISSVCELCVWLCMRCASERLKQIFFFNWKDKMNVYVQSVYELDWISQLQMHTVAGQPIWIDDDVNDLFGTHNTFLYGFALLCFGFLLFSFNNVSNDRSLHIQTFCCFHLFSSMEFFLHLFLVSFCSVCFFPLLVQRLFLTQQNTIIHK